MALENTPWMIGGGAEHSAAIARTIAYAATGGRSGVASPTDLRVAAQNVPNGTVRVLAGVGTLVSNYAGGGSQAYVARNLSQTNVTIQPTGSSGGRSDLVVLSILDPEYEGTAPENPNAFNYTRLQVISGVPSTTKNLDNIELPRPSIALARIDIPSNTGTITSGMIKDLRDLPNARSLRKLYTLQPTTAQKLAYPTNAFTNFPSDTFQIDVPEWATHAVIQAEIGSMWINGSAATQAIVIGKIRFTLGNVSTQASWFHHRSTGQGLRFGSTVADTIAIPEGLRGRVIGSAVQLTSTGDSNAGWHLDSSSFANVDIEFQERV